MPDLPVPNHLLPSLSIEIVYTTSLGRPPGDGPLALTLALPYLHLKLVPLRRLLHRQHDSPELFSP